MDLDLISNLSIKPAVSYGDHMHKHVNEMADRKQRKIKSKCLKKIFKPKTNLNHNNVHYLPRFDEPMFNVLHGLVFGSVFTWITFRLLVLSCWQLVNEKYRPTISESHELYQQQSRRVFLVNRRLEHLPPLLIQNKRLGVCKYTSSNQRLWECVRRRNFNTDTLND